MMQPKQILQNRIDAFNKTDANASSQLYHEDAINHQVAKEPVYGKAAIKKMFEDEFAMAE